VKQDRIQNPSSVERAVIESKIAEGNHVILQFDKPIYSGELLRQINNLCGEFGRQLEVRFYGHYGNCFDASVLHSLPDAAALSVDCLTEATNLSALSDLRNLRHLSLGVYRLEEPDFLKRLQLQNLETLCICETAKSNFDLAPIQTCNKLSELGLAGHTKNIHCLQNLPALRQLSVSGISKKQSLDFVSKIQPLKRLVIILGGRANISEIQHPTLEELEIIRVLGFNNIDSLEAFPALRLLAIEDQIRLEQVCFTPSIKNLQAFGIFNCKTLRKLEGLNYLTKLRSVRIGMTALNIDSILQQGLSASLKVFAFYTGKSKENAIIRKRLDALGYREYEARNQPTA
jgi:protein phosphatase 1 regulatory subunit 7